MFTTFGKRLGRLGLLLACLSLSARFASAQTFKILANTYDTPTGSTIVDSSGNIFYMSFYGFSSVDPSCANQAVPPASPEGSWTVTCLYNVELEFMQNLALGKNGHLYGETTNGGPGVKNGDGTVFDLKPPANGIGSWQERDIYDFGTDPSAVGILPVGGPVVSGNLLYSTTPYGGPGNCGEFFQLMPTKVGAWTAKTLYDFSCVGPGAVSPMSQLVSDGAGNFYGITLLGGQLGKGTVFQLVRPKTSGGTWLENVLYSFDGSERGVPLAITALGDGRILGTTADEFGTFGSAGEVFQLTPTSTGWAYRALYKFSGGLDGGAPYAGVLLSRDGKSIYGVGEAGGAFGAGVIFRLDPPATAGGAWSDTVLYSFSGSSGGQAPLSIAYGPDGNLYGTAYTARGFDGGIIFEFIL